MGTEPNNSIFAVEAWKEEEKERKRVGMERYYGDMERGKLL